MVDSSNFEEWLLKAKNDLRAAGILYKSGGCEELVAFHCQQAVEKYFKAFLIKKTGYLYSGHYLMGLLKRCYQIDERFRNYVNHAAFLNSYYIETRYPSEETLVIDEEDAKQCLQYAEEILKTSF